MKNKTQFISDMLEQMNRLWNNGDYAVAKEIFAPGFVRHDLNAGLIEGPQAMAALVRGLRGQYPDLIVTFEETLLDGETAVCQWRFKGTDLGRHAASGTAPTGREVDFKGVDVLHIKDGRIVEDLVYFDQLGVLQQLGLMPRTPA